MLSILKYEFINKTLPVLLYTKILSSSNSSSLSIHKNKYE